MVVELSSVAPMDHLSALLEDVYVRGSVFGRADFRDPWAVHTRGASGAIFHAVLSGRCQIVWDGGSHALQAGDVAVIPHGSAHVMCSDARLDPVPIRDLFPPSEAAVPRASAGGAGALTEIICGTFQFDKRFPNPLLQALPAVVHVPGTARGGWITSTIRWMEDEIDADRPGADAVITRLTDALFVNVVRACLEQADVTSQPWLAAIADPNISRAISAIHTHPAEEWTAAALARRAGMSRSAFYTRFVELVGEPPAAYLSRRRMHVAAHILASEPLTVAEVASRVGYRSESSFSKAFKRHFGLSPSDFRAL